MKKTVPILLLVGLFAGAAWYSLTRGPEPVDELPPPPPAPAGVAAEPGPEALPGPGPDWNPPAEETVPLPALADSDPAFSAGLSGLAGAEALARYLVKDQLISRIVATIDSLGGRQVPAQVNPVRAPEGSLLADPQGETFALSERNFSRYRAHVELFEAVDSEAALALYRRFYPLFQEAWEENGGQGAFNGRLLEVIDALLATPEPVAPIYLLKPEAVYLFEDPQLEGLSAGQKILLRMGAANAAAVKAKLAEFRQGLGAG